MNRKFAIGDFISRIYDDESLGIVVSYQERRYEVYWFSDDCIKWYDESFLMRPCQQLQISISKCMMNDLRQES